MTSLVSTFGLGVPAINVTGPSGEMRRFSAGIRLVTALLCTVLLLSIQPELGPGVMSLLLTYGAWAAWLLWREASGRSHGAPIWYYAVDIGWALLVMALAEAGTAMLTVTLVHPVVFASIGYGVRQGVVLALFGAAGLLLDSHRELFHNLSESWTRALPALLVLGLVPAAAMIARPMSMLRRRLALIESFEAQIDPRRGLAPICAELVERLRASTQADVVVLVLPSALGSPAMLASRGDSAFRTRSDVHVRLEALLAQTPDCPATFIRRPRWDPRRRVHLHAEGVQTTPTLADTLASLATELEVRSLHVVPLTRYGRRHGHFIVGYTRGTSPAWDMAALARSAPELLRVIEQATLVDQLQDESASHERARIGRDLHDSAIQPYLGLKFAVESVALRIPADNPARAEVNSLAQLVNGEVAALRELISGLRTGGEPGDDALVPAVRRQVRRFAVLFGIDVDLDCAGSLPTTRALASAVFHIVNESLNNVRKHTCATHIWVRLSASDGAIELSVRDDAGSVLGQPGPAFSPRSLTERVTELGGSLHVAHHDGFNTELRIRIPVVASQLAASS